MSKAEQREQRKLASQARFEATRAATLAKVVLTNVPTVAANIKDQLLQPKAIATIPPLEVLQTPKAVKVGSNFASRMTWCHRKKDVDGAWTWDELRAWTEDEWSGTIQPAMAQFEQMTWGHIDTFASGTGHKMHHSQALDEIGAEAQARWMDLGLEEFDMLFRFRLGNKRRVWGFRLEAHFFMVWSERQHLIAPTA